jgi:hypothetical protein
MDSSLNKLPNKELRWLSGLGPSYTSDVRAFVLKTHMRKRRRLAAASSHETDDEVDGRGLRHTTREVSQYSTSPSSKHPTNIFADRSEQLNQRSLQPI